MRKSLPIFFIPLLFFAALFGEPLSLAELVDIALKNNPETQKVWWNVKRAQASLGIAKSTLYPTIDTQGSVNHGREVKFPNGPYTNFTFGSAELFLNYLLYDFGERNAAIQATKDALLAAKWSSDFTIQRIIYKVSAHYYEYLNAEELLRSRESSLNDAELILESAEEMHKAGLRSINDLNTSRAAVAQMQMDVAQQKAHVGISYGKLMTSMGVPVETELSVQTMPSGMQNPLFKEGIPQLIAAAEKQRADLLAKKAVVAEMKARVKRANRADWPKLRGVGRGGWLQYSKHENSSYDYNVGLALDIPIFKGFEYMYQRRLALAEEEMSEAELRDLQDDIALEVLTFSKSAQAAEEALQWSEQYLDEATKSYEGSLACYKAGLQNIFDLIQTQRYLADARIKKAQARTQWLVSLAELAFATGSIIP